MFSKLLQKPSYITHAKCINCFHHKESVFWFQKPITRCPKCGRSLRQNTKKRIYRERVLVVNQVLNKEQRAKKLGNIRTRRWKSKNRSKLSNDYKIYYEKNKDRILERKKQQRIQNDPVAIHQREYSKSYKEKNREKIKLYNKIYKEKHKEELRIKRLQSIKSVLN